ncbi:putative zinc metalloprotease sll0528 [Arthrobacter sp. Hiyo8]|uniref:Zinc metalloprotease n=1 Tax=Arthrobacter bambusae TaxID=1338426 RepID=A0AAW8DBU5_9MICC|nr:site-2 protease family protein [Arthrobacter bambusae]MDP9904099.1 Zn-dependent protease [Arthrobacter bambusae]MDQ0127905.1 Zn-dependent protease [Arthrobacter bambusae]MDQ0179247.1 Zn-dependent protease [Arthrobacter bambusae]BAS18084.1 putative zinc metalloprotease sll0528 [Arthrobacter sp. Hiyo8]
MSTPRNGGHSTRSSRKDGIPLGRIAGIPVYLAYSWFIIAAFTVIAVGPVVFVQHPSLGNGAYFVAFAYAVLLALSVLVHELAHALSAKAFNWPTEKIVLNLWGGHTQFESFISSPGRSVLVALAGPAANFVLAAAAWPLVVAHVFGGVAEELANSFMWANLLIGIFNVLPGLPLDGGRLVESAVWKVTGSQEKGTVAAGWAGRIVVIVLVVGFIAPPLLSGSPINFTYMLITLLVCSFLWMGASGAIKQATLRGRLPSVSAAALAEPAVGIPNSATVAEVLRVAPYGTPAVVICGPDGRPQGLVDPAATAAVPASEVSTTFVTAVSTPLADGAYVPWTSSGQELIQYLAQLSGAEYAVVDERGTVMGLLRQQAVVTAITGKVARRSGRP